VHVSQLREHHSTDPSSHYSDLPPELLNSVTSDEDEVQDNNSNELSDGTKQNNNFVKEITREKEVLSEDKQEEKAVEQVNSADNEVGTPFLDTSLDLLPNETTRQSHMHPLDPSKSLSDKLSLEEIQPRVLAVPPPTLIEPNGTLLPSSHGPHTSQVQLDPTHTPPKIFTSKTIFPPIFIPSAPSITDCLSSTISNLEDKVSSGPDSNVSKQIDQKTKRRILKPYWDSDFVRK
jgi:hypothetical protein